jgi:glycosyltransferase involved in cell wall biosynthesis
MRWIVAAPFFASPAGHWLDAFVPGQRHTFEIVTADYAHDRSRPRTALGGWADYFRHVRRALAPIPRHDHHIGLITCFPQLPMMAGLLSRLTRRRNPIVAWAFNLGSLPGGLRRHLARLAFKRVDLFVVHSRAEILACSTWLGIGADRFMFVPLQCPSRSVTQPEDLESPYVIAMGTANRDYPILFEVMRELGYRTIVISGPHAVEGLARPENIEVLSGISIDECHRLLQGARVSVIPVANEQTASGQVTLLDSLAFGRPTVVTRCPGSIDYIIEGETALAVPPGDKEAMRVAIASLWGDETLRAKLSTNGRAYAQAHFSDEAVGAMLGRVCDIVEHRISNIVCS